MNRYRKEIFLLSFILIFTLLFYSCKTVKFTSTNQPLPSYYSFSLDTTSRHLAALDTSHIYVHGQDIVRTYKNGKIEKFFAYRFLKFSSNGLAFYSNTSKENFNEKNIYLNSGQVCFYKIIDEEVQLEMYDYHLKKFSIMYFKVFPDKMLFYKEKLRIFAGGSEKYDMIFNKTNILYNKQLQFPQ